MIAGVAGGSVSTSGSIPWSCASCSWCSRSRAGSGSCSTSRPGSSCPTRSPATEVDPSDVRDRRHTGLAIGAVVLLVLLGGFGHWASVGFDGAGRLALDARRHRRGRALDAQRARAGPDRTPDRTECDRDRWTPTIGRDHRWARSTLRDPWRDSSAGAGASLLRRLVPAVGRLVLVVLAGLAGLVVALAAVVAPRRRRGARRHPDRGGRRSLAVLARRGLARDAVPPPPRTRRRRARGHPRPRAWRGGSSLRCTAGTAPATSGPSAAAALHDEYRLAAGRLRLDLSR